MAIDLSHPELKLLINQFRTGHVVLFAGAGFSLGAHSGTGREPPPASQLAVLLAAECGAEYSGEDLSVVYEYAQKRLGSERLHSFLSSLYRDCVPAAEHLIVPKLFWARIYTTNIDDVIQNAYHAASAAQRLRTIVCPATYADRDPWFEDVQCVHLHGSVLDLGKGLTFSPTEFAGQTAVPSPWYQALMDDLYAESVLFVGTRLSDPPFHHYLAVRSLRARGQREFRGAAFLVSPHITPIRRRQLEDQGISPIDATTEEFFSALLPELERAVPTRLDLLKNRYPHQIEAITSGLLTSRGALLREFEYVRPVAAPARRSARDTFFFEGAEPTWEDIAAEVDARRSMTAGLLDDLRAPGDGLRMLLLTGHAGSGKSCLLRRLAFELARSGTPVYFLKSEHRLTPGPVIELLKSGAAQRICIFVDDAHAQLDVLEEIIGEVGVETNATIVIAERAHAVLHRLHAFQSVLTQVEMPQLDRDDSNRILDRLQAFGLLGALHGKSRERQIREFMGRSRKQLLVALKEATAGKGFDVILANEFATLASDDARLAYTVCCLAYMHGVPVARRHLLAVMAGPDLEKGRVLREELRGVVVPWQERAEFLCPRHRVIARQVAVETVPFDLKESAVIRFLTEIAAGITPENIKRRTPEYVGYRGIINLDNMLELFGEDYDTLARIYGDLDAIFGDDFLFKLQFGRAELHFDHFDRAENYLNQSLSIRKKEQNVHAWHQMGVLRLKRARYETNSGVAAEHAKAGEEILREQIAVIGSRDAYPYAALVQHKLRYLRDKRPPGMADQLKDLYQLAQVGLERHPLDSFMRETHTEVTRAYLMQAVP
jgi:hypothetical protein